MTETVKGKHREQEVITVRCLNLSKVLIELVLDTTSLPEKKHIFLSIFVRDFVSEFWSH